MLKPIPTCDFTYDDGSHCCCRPTHYDATISKDPLIKIIVGEIITTFLCDLHSKEKGEN